MPPAPPPVPAATIIPVRPRAGGSAVEVLLLRRHRRASFMANSFVFPGGRVDADDPSPEAAAVRELFEEAGVLLTRPPLAAAAVAELRARHRAGAPFAALLAAAGVAAAVARLHLWARWVTPSFERKRFDARFYLAEVPADAEARCDAEETVAQVWVTPAEALARQEAGTLPLPPPQLVTLAQLAPVAAQGLAPLLAAADARAGAVRPVMPRPAAAAALPTLLLPWDPDYATGGVGEGTPIPAGAPGSDGPSRLVLDGGVWRSSIQGA
jgi:8-oxo-dGTP pyrophosphatase MutT (NUDIX family)